MEIKNCGYENALKKVVDVRLQRKKIYGDQWQQMQIYELVAMIKQKTSRLEHMFLNGTNNYEKMEDTLIDNVNYNLFLLEILQRRQHENRNLRSRKSRQ